MFSNHTQEPETDFMVDQDNAILWARKQLNGNFVVLDTETTGLDNRAEVVQLGVVSKTGKVLLDCLLKPLQPIPPGATAVHGIIDDDVKDAVDIRDILPALTSLLFGRVILIYNADYDTRLLNQSCRLRGLGTPILSSQLDCVMLAYGKFFGEWDDYHGNYRWQKLTQAARHFGIKTDGAHGAVQDALMTLRVVEAMAKSRLSYELH